MLKPTQAVLIIENDLATAEMYQRALSQYYQVFIGTVEEDILALVSAHNPYVVVLEPGPLHSRGWAWLAELQRHPKMQAIPIVICTSQDRRRLDQEMSVAAYLVKPVLPVTLLEMVRQLTYEGEQEL